MSLEWGYFRKHGGPMRSQKPTSYVYSRQQHFAISMLLAAVLRRGAAATPLTSDSSVSFVHHSSKSARSTTCQKTWKFDFKSPDSPSNTPSHWEYINIAKRPGRSSAWKLSIKNLKDRFKAVIFLCSLPFLYHSPASVYMHVHTPFHLCNHFSPIDSPPPPAFPSLVLALSHCFGSYFSY